LFFTPWQAIGQSLGKWGVFVSIFFRLSEKGKGEKQGNKSFLFPCLAFIGEEEDPQCRSKRHRLGLFSSSFLKQWIKRRSFIQNTPFHLKENGAKNVSKSKSSLICDLFNQILNCNFDFPNQFNCILTKFNRRP
jgi:hypothetical protein